MDAYHDDGYHEQESDGVCRMVAQHTTPVVHTVHTRIGVVALHQVFESVSREKQTDEHKGDKSADKECHGGSPRLGCTS